MKIRNRIAATIARASLLLFVTTVACHRAARSNSAPVVQSVRPDHADVSRGQVVQVTVDGIGFDSLNTVHFGAIELHRVLSTSATSLRFTVPLDDSQRPARGEAPPMPLGAGSYDVRVATAHGVSNVIRFTIDGGRAR